MSKNENLKEKCENELEEIMLEVNRIDNINSIFRELVDNIGNTERKLADKLYSLIHCNSLMLENTKNKLNNLYNFILTSDEDKK